MSFAPHAKVEDTDWESDRIDAINRANQIHLDDSAKQQEQVEQWEAKVEDSVKVERFRSAAECLSGHLSKDCFIPGRDAPAILSCFGVIGYAKALRAPTA